MKTIKHILEEARTSAAPDEDKLDSYRQLAKKEEIPMMLVFKRQNIRNMNGIKVGLYYSPVLGKFITIPFGGKDLEQGSNLNENQDYNVDIFNLARSGIDKVKKLRTDYNTGRETSRKTAAPSRSSTEQKDPRRQKMTNPRGFEDRANKEIQNYVSAVQSIRKTKEARAADPEAFKSNTKTNLRYSADSDRVEHEKVTPLTGDVNRARASVRRLTALGIGVPVVRKNTAEVRRKRQELAAAAAKERASTQPKKPARTPGAVIPPSPAGPIDENNFMWDAAKGSISKLRDFIKNKKQKKNAPAAPTQPQGETSASSGQRHVAGQASRVEVNRANKDGSSAGAENYRRKSMPAFSIQESNLQKIHKLVNTNEATINIVFPKSKGSIEVDKNQARSVTQLYESLSAKNKTKMESMIAESADSYKKVLEFALKGTYGK